MHTPHAVPEHFRRSFESLTIAHDYFTQRGGAERVAAALIDALKPERITSAVYAKGHTFAFDDDKQVETSFLQVFRPVLRDPRRALLLFPLAWRLFAPASSSTLICSSSGWSHALRAAPATTKIVYCHNPARWLYQPNDYFRHHAPPVVLLMRILNKFLVAWDQRAAATADLYIANSSAVAARIREVYRREAPVLHPPISIDPSGPQDQPLGTPAAFHVTIGRGRGYKNVSAIVAAFALLPSQNLVVVGIPPGIGKLPSNVTVLPSVSDSQLRWLYANAKSLISVSHEDFGLTPLEANAFGTPALLLRAGGFLDSLLEGVSGHFVDSADPAAIATAVQDFPTQWDRHAIREHADQFTVNTFVAELAELVRAVRAAKVT